MLLGVTHLLATEEEEEEDKQEAKEKLNLLLELSVSDN